MGKKIHIKNFEFEINSNEITSIIGNSKERVISFLKRNYNLLVVDDLFKDDEILVKNIIANTKKSEELIELLGIKYLLNKKYGDLGIEDKALVRLSSYLSTQCEIIIFNDILSYLKLEKKKKIIKYIKNKKITLLNFTSNVEEVLLGDNLIVINKNEVVLSGQTIEVLKSERILNELGLSLPFIINLSIQLGLYGLISKIYISAKKLIGDLWK